MALWRPGKEVVLFTNPIGRKLLDGLVAYWPLDEASGTRRDLSGNGLTLTDNNTVTGNPGPSYKLPLAGQFTAANSEYLSRASEPLLQTGDIDWAIGVFLRLDTLPGAGKFPAVVSKWGTVGQLEYTLFVNGNDNKPRLQVSPDGTGTPIYAVGGGLSSAMSIDTWYFLLAWHDSVNNVIGLRLDNEEAVVAHALGVRAGTDALRIGTDNVATSFINGRIAAIPFWKRVPAPAERVYMAQGRMLIPGRGFV